MQKFIRMNLPLIILVLAALFFYTFRLEETFVMAGDTARDLNDVMHIWQNKIITVVGEPVNTISNNPTQVLFGSLYLYLGLLGLLIFNFNPAGAVFADITLTLISVPLLFLVAKTILKKKNLAFFAAFIYALSPITVALARSYWEPNIVIPLSVIAWFFFLHKPSLKKFFLAGFFTGIVFDIHYMNVFPLAVYMIILFLKKDKKPALYSLLGFILAVSPLIGFELKNNFYLTRAFIGTFSGFSTFAERTLNPFLSMDILLYIFGLGPYQYFIPSLVEIDFKYRIVFGTIAGIAFIYYLIKKQKLIKPSLVVVILASLLFSWYFEKWHIIGLRYILSTYPIFIIAFIGLISSLSSNLLFVPIIPMLILSIKIVTHKLDYTNRNDYLPLERIEEISNAIVADNPTDRYNVTENILGDARSLAFRFYLLRDAEVKPQPVEIYDSIDTLYVITPSLEKTLEEGRWEFSASGPKEIAWEKDFEDLKLFKFVK